MDITKKVHIGSLLELYGALLTENQRDVMNLYYDMDISLGEIGEQLGISRQGVRDTILRSEAKLLEYEGALRLLLKRQALVKGLKEAKCLERPEAMAEILKLLEDIDGI